MKRAKEVLLDFTPLLDVTMILLFFFVLFSRIGVDGIRQDAEQTYQQAQSVQAEAAQIMQDAEAVRKDAEQMRRDAEQKMQILAEADENSAESAEAMLAFSRGENYRLRLKMEPDGWVLRIYHGKDLVDALADNSDFSGDLLDSLERIGWEPEQTQLCAFCYEAADPGSRAAYQRVSDALNTARKLYPHVYISEMDLSQ